MPTDTPARFVHRPALDGLRAVAVLAVMGYHLGYDRLRGGFLGVDTFFVLSGYLITSLLLVERAATGTISLGAFWSRRAKRLLPAIVLLVAAVAWYAAALAPADRRGSLRVDGLATLGYVANWRLVLSEQSYFELFSTPSPLRHMWSLAIEEQYYVVWPLLVVAALRVAGGRVRGLVGLCVLGIAGSAALMAAQFEPADPSLAYYSTLARAHSLLVGALLGVLLRHWSPQTMRGRAALHGAGGTAAVAAVATMAIVSDREDVLYRGGFLVFAVLVAVVIASASQLAPSPLRTVLSWRPLRWIGTISYGLYLWHWFVIVVATHRRLHLDGHALAAAQVALTFVIATASFYLVERPIRLARWKPSTTLRTAPLALGLTALVVLAATTDRAPVPAQLATGGPITAAPTTGPTGSVEPGSVVSGPGTTIPSTSAPGGPGAFDVDVIGVVGDSVAVTLAWGLDPTLRAVGVSTVSVAFPGCGVASGFVLDDAGDPFQWSASCADNIPRVHEQLVADHDPDLVVWLSTWELSNRREAGEVVRLGTAAHDEALLRSIDEAAGRLTAGGARLAILTVVPRAPGEVAPAESDVAHYDHYNDLLRAYASAHPDRVSIVDLAAIVCPGGAPCPERVDGIRLRPDGAHFTEETATWVAGRLAPLLAALPPPAAA